MIQTGARWLHTWLAWLFVAAVFVQVFLAGLAIFDATADFSLHIGFGYSVIGLLALGILLAAVVARVGRTAIALSLLLFILYLIQTALPQARTSLPVLAALHPVNALVMFGLGVTIARRGSAAGSRAGSN
jgi:hypothetical protein